MKLLIFLLLPVQALALTCFDSSSGLMASINRDSEKVHFRFSAGRGYESIPQFEGPVSASDLKMIRFQTESLKEVGDGFEISIPSKDCDFRRAEEGIFACYSEGKIAGTELQFSALTGYKTKQSHASGDFETRSFRLMIGKGDRFFFAIPFPAHSCSGSL